MTALQIKLSPGLGKVDRNYCIHFCNWVDEHPKCSRAFHINKSRTSKFSISTSANVAAPKIDFAGDLRPKNSSILM